VDWPEISGQTDFSGWFDGIDIALFAGTEGEKVRSDLCCRCSKRGAVVIDNERLPYGPVPLVVPEVNAKDVKRHKA